MSINITSYKAIFLNLMAVTKIPGAQQTSKNVQFIVTISLNCNKIPF